MHVRREIFLVSTVLLVPFIYGESYIPEVCAEPKDPKFGAGGTCEFTDETKNRITCCWSEPDINNPGEFIVWCQTCDLLHTNCGPVSLKKSTGEMGIPPGSVLEDPSTPPKLGQDNMTFSKSNVPFPQANDSDDNMTFSKSNVPFPQANDSDNNTNNTLVLQHLDVENETAENNTGEMAAEGEQDGSVETEDSSEEPDE